jgi:hypothetical protein
MSGELFNKLVRSGGSGHLRKDLISVRGVDLHISSIPPELVTKLGLAKASGDRDAVTAAETDVLLAAAESLLFLKSMSAPIQGDTAHAADGLKALAARGMRKG